MAIRDEKYGIGLGGRWLLTCQEIRDQTPIDVCDVVAKDGVAIMDYMQVQERMLVQALLLCDDH
jgi:hypothetical protein